VCGNDGENSGGWACYALNISLCWLPTFRQNVCGLSSRRKQTRLHLGGNLKFRNNGVAVLLAKTVTAIKPASKMVDTDELTAFNPSNSDNSDAVFVEQFVHSVRGFSSQYGRSLSISYTADNIVGKPSKFPDYGDFPQTFVMVR